MISWLFKKMRDKCRACGCRGEKKYKTARDFICQACNWKINEHVLNMWPDCVDKPKHIETLSYYADNDHVRQITTLFWEIRYDNYYIYTIRKISGFLYKYES